MHQAFARFLNGQSLDDYVAEMGTKSAKFAYRGRCEGRAVATAEITVACIAMDTFQAQPIPPKYRALFEAHREPPTD